MSDIKIDYRKYIASSEWKKKSEETLHRSGYVCENCGKEGEYVLFNVHHLNYQNLGNEKPEELIVLCDACHYSVHNKGLNPQRKFGKYHIDTKTEEWVRADFGLYDEQMEKYTQHLDDVRREQEQRKKREQEQRKKKLRFSLWLLAILIILLCILFKGF